MKATDDDDDDQIYIKQICSEFYEFLVVECCISLNMHFIKSLKEF